MYNRKSSSKSGVFPPGHMIDHRSEVSRPVQLNCPQTLMICLQYSLNPITVGILHVSILGNKKEKA